MKPLSIEELHALNDGDWVWVEDNEKPEETGYRQVKYEVGNSLCVREGYIKYTLEYADYGKSWIAYKNKEEAETKGDILELPCLRPIIFKGNSSEVEMYELAFLDKYGMIQTVVYSDDELPAANARLRELRDKQ